MKKHLSIILALIMVLSTFTPAFGTNDEKELYEQAEILKYRCTRVQNQEF